MTLFAEYLPPESLKLAMDTRRSIKAAQSAIQDHNYGFAHEWLEAALRLLPEDTGDPERGADGIVWPELERRTT